MWRGSTFRVRMIRSPGSWMQSGVGPQSWKMHCSSCSGVCSSWSRSLQALLTSWGKAAFMKINFCHICNLSEDRAGFQRTT